jgi:hypothetical protein
MLFGFCFQNFLKETNSHKLLALQLLFTELPTSANARVRIVAILEKYQEQSQLLDPHLEAWVRYKKHLQEGTSLDAKKAGIGVAFLVQHSTAKHAD